MLRPQTNRKLAGPNVTGHISFNSGPNNIWIHAVVDMNNDGTVDFGSAALKVNAANPVSRVNVGVPTSVRFEYTVGNSTYDLL